LLLLVRSLHRYGPKLCTNKLFFHSCSVTFGFSNVIWTCVLYISEQWWSHPGGWSPPTAGAPVEPPPPRPEEEEEEGKGGWRKKPAAGAPLAAGAGFTTVYETHAPHALASFLSLVSSLRPFIQSWQSADWFKIFETKNTSNT
jgi:hypothetical protein